MREQKVERVLGLVFVCAIGILVGIYGEKIGFGKFLVSDLREFANIREGAVAGKGAAELPKK